MNKLLIAVIAIIVVLVSSIAFATNSKGEVEVSFYDFGPYEEMLTIDAQFGIAIGQDGKFQFYPYMRYFAPVTIVPGKDFVLSDLSLGTSFILGKYSSFSVEATMDQNTKYKGTKSSFKLEW
jgi:hypothetical protein